jgi:cytochrome bd-type quinol oxidase subunit 2
MGFAGAVVVGALLGLVGAGIAVSENSLEAVIGIPILLLVLALVGGILSFVGSWLNSDPEAERPKTPAQYLGQTAVVTLGLLVGVVIGIVFGFGMGMH